MKKLALLLVLVAMFSGCAATQTVVTIEPDPFKPNKLNWSVSVVVPNTIEMPKIR